MKNKRLNSKKAGSVMKGFMPQLFELMRVRLVLSHLPFVLFITVLLMIYIASGHYADRMIRKINKMHYLVKEYKTQYIASKAKYIALTKESALLKTLKPRHFEALKTIPLLIQDTALYEH